MRNFLRSLFVTRTDYDLDKRFTSKQQEIILKALQGLANHPVYGPKMAELAAKGADINIIADFRGDVTGNDHGAIDGRNEDGTVDPGESITIYINMNPGGAPVSNTAFAEAVTHELLHTFGDPALDAELQAPGSTLDRDVRNGIFFGYDYNAPADLGSVEPDIVDTPDTGGIVAGSANYEIFSGSDFADEIAPGAGGSLIYSGDGDDRIILALDGDTDEIIDTAGLDTILLPAGTSLSSIYTRWSVDQRNLAIMVNGNAEAIIVDAAGNGAVEQISINGINYALSAFSATMNVAPASATISATVYDSFCGGSVASGAVSDGNGDTLSYRIGSIAGDYAEQDWGIDSSSGWISADFTRYAAPGSMFTFLTVIVSDGPDESHVSVIIRWAESGTYEPPLEGVFEGEADQPFRDVMVVPGLLQSESLETPAVYG